MIHSLWTIGYESQIFQGDKKPLLDCDCDEESELDHGSTNRLNIASPIQFAGLTQDFPSNRVFNRLKFLFQGSWIHGFDMDNLSINTSHVSCFFSLRSGPGNHGLYSHRSKVCFRLMSLKKTKIRFLQKSVRSVQNLGLQMIL